jgi:glycosyltransferase involved in cell wall biosynthesis
MSRTTTAVASATVASAAGPPRLGVAMLIQSYYPRIGGAESNLQALIRPFAERGIQVRVLTRRFPGMARREVVAGAPVHRLPVPGGRIAAALAFTASAVWLLARSRRSIDVIHAHELLSPTTTGILAKLLLRRPVVAHVLRGGLLGDVAVLRRAPLGRPRLWLFTRLVDAFVVVSAETEGELLALGVPRERLALVPYGVDTSRFRPAPAGERDRLRRELGLDARRPVVLFVARLEPEKGAATLLDAWPAIKATIPDALLLIAGDGSERAALEARAGARPDVRFLGAVRDPLPYLQAADCYTLPSASEGLPNSLVEALATGLPCVATTIGGSTEVLDHGRLGWLVPPGDASALAAAILEALRLDPAARRRRGAAGRARVQEQYSLETNADRLDGLYRRLAAVRRQRP